MFSGLSKLADRNFIIGFFLPTLLGAVLVVIVWQNFNFEGSFISSLIRGNTFKDLTVFALVIWVAAVLLSVLNLPTYRLLEGYFGPFSLRRRYDRYRNTLKKEQDNLKTAFNKISTGEGTAAEYYERLRRLSIIYPTDVDSVMPTKFGNVIAAFENYTRVVYGVDSVGTWLRLAAIIPTHYLLAIENAKAEVDFFVTSLVVVNVCILVAIAKLGVSVYSVISIGPLADVWGIIVHIEWRFLACVVALGIIEWLVYRGAIDRAKVWGEFVKSAFDVYLPDLAYQLGYKLPPSWERRKKFWEAVTFMYADLNPTELEQWLNQGGEVNRARSARELSQEGASNEIKDKCTRGQRTS
jgi:hypothetical protein